MNYYVYYKVAPERLRAVRFSVKEIMKKAKSQFAIEGRWMRRRDDPATYMEVYEGVEDAAAFDAFLEAEGKALGVERRVERFISAETPA